MTAAQTIAPKTIALAPVRKTILVKARREIAFSVFATIGWWPKTHSILGEGKVQKDVILEPRAGGRWYERGEDGSEAQWGRVLAWEPPARMLLTWQINKHFQCDPSAETEVEVRFIAEGPKLTRVELEHRNFELMGDGGDILRHSVDQPGGWTGVLALFAATAELTEA